jgi:hypothetical protein
MMKLGRADTPCAASVYMPFEAKMAVNARLCLSLRFGISLQILHAMPFAANDFCSRRAA